jgi:hypothetical protein
MIKLYSLLYVEICPKFEEEILSEMFSAEMEFCQIGPR